MKTILPLSCCIWLLQLGYLSTEILKVPKSSGKLGRQDDQERRLRIRIQNALKLCFPTFNSAKTIMKILSLIDKDNVTAELLMSISQMAINDGVEASVSASIY